MFGSQSRFLAVLVCFSQKIMHYSGVLGHKLREAAALGWDLKDMHEEENKKHNWPRLVQNVGDYIKGLNFQYKKTLTDARVEYINAYAKLIDAHTVSYTDSKGNTKETTADKIILAVGGRPKYPDGVENASTLGITSDDIFWRSKPPGKTLCVGASYISLECAGFLHELGFDVSVMVRSILLRGFDTQSAIQIGEYMERSGVRFVSHAVPTKLERLNGDDGKITVTFTQAAHTNGQGEQVPAGTHTEEFDTVLFATGRDACTDIGLDKVGVRLQAGKVVVNEAEQTSVDNIYAIGDVILDRPELTPVAIKAGQLLAKRLYGNSTQLMDYRMIPTTVFTPIEYGSIGYSEEAAIAHFGKENIKVYGSRFGVLEGASVYKDVIPTPRSSVFLGQNLWSRNFALAHGQSAEDVEWGSYEAEEEARKALNQPCLAKLICNTSDNERVVGWHYVGPDAGEITQGFGLTLKLGATKADFDNLVGIHPTSAEEFTQLTAVQSEGQEIMKTGGC